MKFLPPDQVFQELFSDLHHSGIWPDGKTISDMTPLFPPEVILDKYRSERNSPGFDLKAFTEANFEIPTSKTSGFQSDTTRPIAEHINILWDWLKREADEDRPGSSLIPLPHPYIVPGGRFNEIYYWDSYFTMLGLQVSGRVDIIENMMKNFAYLIDQFGFIPNGNRTYFLGRSQPPFFSLMVQLLSEEKGEGIYEEYFIQLLIEYEFWMHGREAIFSEKIQAAERAVLVDDTYLFNRYYDQFHTPRAEMYATDLECAMEAERNPEQLYLDLRAACESGWDFSARWLKDPHDLTTIHTTDIIPVDLNCLLFHLEETLAKTLTLKEEMEDADYMQRCADRRKEAILDRLWDASEGFFMDYDFVEKQHTDVHSLAGMFPLFFKIATQDQAARCAKIIEHKFLCPGGVISTPIHSGQQWDAPNGWAPLQWITIQGLRNYGFDSLADDIKNRWIDLNTKVFRNTGKMLEKYNVENIDLPTGGGEYPVQDGFGWTNGVLLKLIS